MPFPGRGLLCACALLATALAGRAAAQPSYTWAPGRLLSNCEAPDVFYSAQHVDGNQPCCPTIEGVCAGGVACPADGACPGGGRCIPGPVVDRPNAILFVADDQGYCHYGSAGECRSSIQGTPLPAPKTPNVDLLSGYGTMFPIAHDTASWCFPSARSIYTARFQKDMHGARDVSEAFFDTIPSVLRNLGNAPGTVGDPYNGGDKVGGYCTLLAGKLSAGIDKSGFDAIGTTNYHLLGRNRCVTGPAGLPECGTAMQTTYAPFANGRMSDVFDFLDALVYPRDDGGPTQYAMEHFFVWYFPHLPHEPLNPRPPIQSYLFGPTSFFRSITPSLAASTAFPFGGVMDLGQWCSGASCAPTISAFGEGQFGNDYSYYGQVWWTDDNVRELRRFLAAETAPHCIGADGRSRFGVADAAHCNGTWSGVAPDLERNTVFIYLTDNGWQLPRSKHAFTENGYRTRLLVYDPRTLPVLPPWDPTQATAPPANNSPAVAHAVDILPTLLGFALGTPGSQPCPVGPDGLACDGRDLRPVLVTAPGGPAAPETLRHALCGHETQRPSSPTRNRYLVTRPGSIGRCTDATAPSCAGAPDCAAGQFCLGGHCATDALQTPCGSTAACPGGAVCLGGFCREGPACQDDDDCTALLGAGFVCGGKDQTWCRNQPNVACTTAADCPACPTVGGSQVPCGRLCEARVLKFYTSPGTDGVELTDLFLDPDEKGLHQGNEPSLVASLSDPAGGYADLMRRMNCCVDDWWPEIVQQTGTLCTSGRVCPSDLACNE